MDHTEIGLQSVIRALKDVVLPAVNPENSLAVEQLRLSIDYVAFVADRIELLSDREWAEFHQHCDMAEALLKISGLVGITERSDIECTLTRLEGLRMGGTVPSRRVRSATAELASTISSLARHSSSLDAPTRREIHRCIVAHSKTRVSFERAWYAPLGFDPEPETMAPLGEMLATDKPTQRAKVG